ncbi:MAG: hypothetical protein ABI682_08585 [Acidobacteriota bacterium]
MRKRRALGRESLPLGPNLREDAFRAESDGDTLGRQAVFIGMKQFEEFEFAFRVRAHEDRSDEFRLNELEKVRDA